MEEVLQVFMFLFTSFLRDLYRSSNSNTIKHKNRKELLLYYTYRSNNIEIVIPRVSKSIRRNINFSTFFPSTLSIEQQQQL